MATNFSARCTGNALKLMRCAQGPLAILLLLGFFSWLFMPGCGTRKEDPALANGNQPTETKTGEIPVEQKEQPRPRIGPLFVEPVSRVDISGVFIIDERVKIWVEAPGARKVEFYAAPVAEQALGVLFWEDDRPAEITEAFWEPPLAGEVFRLTALAFYNGEKLQSAADVLWPQPAPPTLPTPVADTEPFKRIAPQSVITLVEGVPLYFHAGGWVDDQTIFGLTGTTPVLYNLETGETGSPGIPAWGARLSPDKQQIAYTREDGVHVVSIDGSDATHIWPREIIGTPEGEGYFGGGFWSPSGEKLLVWWEHEWDSEFFICEPRDGVVNKINTRLDGYFLNTATDWVDEQKIIFTTRANMMKDGTREYTFGYRSNVAVYNLQTDSFQLISDTVDGEFIESLSAGPEGILFLRWFNNRETTSYGVMDAAGRVIWEEPFYHRMDFFLAPDGRTVACLVETGRQEMNTLYELVIRSQGVISRSILEIEMANHILPEIFWHPDGNKMLFTFISTMPRDDAPGSYQDKYYTLIVEP